MFSCMAENALCSSLDWYTGLAISFAPCCGLEWGNPGINFTQPQWATLQWTGRVWKYPADIWKPVLFLFSSKVSCNSWKKAEVSTIHTSTPLCGYLKMIRKYSVCIYIHIKLYVSNQIVAQFYNADVLKCQIMCFATCQTVVPSLIIMLYFSFDII